MTASVIVGWSFYYILFARLLTVCAARKERDDQCPPDEVCAYLHRYPCVQPLQGCGACLHPLEQIDGQCIGHGAGDGEHERVDEEGEAKVQRVERAAAAVASTVLSPTVAKSVQNNIKGKSSDNSVNSILVIALSVGAVVCFFFGIIVACLCLKSMRVNLKETSVAEYPFGTPGKPRSAPLAYSSEEQAQLFNFEQRKAQLRSSSTMRGTSPYASGSGEDASTTGEEDLQEALHPGESHDTLYVSSGQRQTKLKVVNPAFPASRRSQSVSASRSSSGYSTSACTPPAHPEAKPVVRSSTL